MTENSDSTTTQSANSSTLLEFPGVNRNRPAWRKELSERFREIQQRRAREAAVEAEVSPETAPRQNEAEAALEADAARKGTATPKHKSSETKQLGLVPTPDEPEINPIVAAALRRIERARAQSAATPVARTGGSNRAQAATAAARVLEEQPEDFEQAAPARRAETQNTDLTNPSTAAAKTAPRRADKTAESEGDAARGSTLVVVPPKRSAPTAPQTSAQTDSTAFAQAAAPAREATNASAPSEKVEAATPAVESKTQTPEVVSTSSAPEAAVNARQPRHLAGVIDEFWLERHGLDPLPKVAAPEMNYDDRAPRAKRLLAALADFFFVAFLCAPFAAIIELTIGNWSDPRVSGVMGGIVLVVMFLYDACSVALAGRTWGMRLCSLHAVDARKASVPTTWQCVRRALIYMLSLATFGLGILYSLFDAEGRTAHDILSGTVVVKN